MSHSMVSIPSFILFSHSCSGRLYKGLLKCFLPGRETVQTGQTNTWKRKTFTPAVGTVRFPVHLACMTVDCRRKPTGSIVRTCKQNSGFPKLKFKPGTSLRHLCCLLFYYFTAICFNWIILQSTSQVYFKLFQVTNVPKHKVYAPVW